MSDSATLEDVLEVRGALAARDAQWLDDVHGLMTQGTHAVEAVQEAARKWRNSLEDGWNRENPSVPLPTITDIGRLHIFAGDIRLIANSVLHAIEETEKDTRHLEYLRGEYRRPAEDGPYYS